MNKVLSKVIDYKETIKILIGTVDVVLIHISFVLSFIIRYQNKVSPINYAAYTAALPYIITIFIIINLFSGIYILYNKKFLDVFSITVINQVILTILTIAVAFFGRRFAFPRSILFINLIVSIFILVLWRLLIFQIYLKATHTTRIMLVGPEEKCRKVLENFMRSNSQQYQIVAATFDNYFINIHENIEDIDLFYLLDFDSLKEKKEILSYLTQENKEIFLDAEFENILQINNQVMNISDESLIGIGKFEISPEKRIGKRILDIILSVFLIILTSPIMLISALLIKLTSEGPILYRQVRITRGENEFQIYKFRTMKVNAEEITGPVLATEKDPRITRIGNYLRSLRIDELPQLFNVLKGEMSIVGPRPERPFFVEQHNKKNSSYYLRHRVRAGITGYAQIYGTYATNFHQKLKFDLLYIKKYSLMLDLQILFQTIRILFDKMSSKGLENNKEEVFNNIDIYT